MVGVPERSTYAPVFATFANVISEPLELEIAPPLCATPAFIVTILALAPVPTEAIVAEPSVKAASAPILAAVKLTFPVL